MKETTSKRTQQGTGRKGTAPADEDMQAAQLIAALTESGATPDYVRDAVTIALQDAGETIDMHWSEWSYPDGVDAEALARLLRRTRRHPLPPRHVVATTTPTIDDPGVDHVFATTNFKDARRIANGKTLQSKEWRDDEIGDLLALMHCLTYCALAGDREEILYEVVNAFMSSIDVARKSMDSFVIARLRADRTE